MVNDSIIDKLRALLNMTTANGCTEAEANTAMEKAQALMLEHNLTQSSVHNANESPTPAGIGQIDRTEDQGYPWKSVLANILAKSMLCRVVVTPSNHTIHFFGTYDNVRGVLQTYHWLIPELERIAISDFTAYRKSGGIEHGRTWKTGFFYGATSTLKTRLQKPLEDFSSGAGRAIVVYNSQALSTAIGRVFPRLGHSSARMSGGSDGIGYGKAAGSRVQLRDNHKLTGCLSLGSGR